MQITKLTNKMKLYIEYQKQDGSHSIFTNAELVGTYEKENRTMGFKVFEEGRGYRNLNYDGIVTIKASNPALL